jgi:hypothetical protein
VRDRDRDRDMDAIPHILHRVILLIGIISTNEDLCRPHLSHLQTVVEAMPEQSAGLVW